MDGDVDLLEEQPHGLEAFEGLLRVEQRLPLLLNVGRHLREEESRVQLQLAKDWKRNKEYMRFRGYTQG